MRTNFVIAVLILAVLFAASCTAPASAGQRIGAGFHYWTAVKNIDIRDVDQNGLSLIFSYQNQMMSIMTLELDLEMLGKGYAGADAEVLSPQAYLLVGKGEYGGAGIGVNKSGGSWSDPFFGLRAGVDLELLPAIHLDINGNYRYETWNFERIKGDVKTGNFTLGAIVRLGF